MKLQMDGSLLVFVVALLAFVRGEEYSAMVSPVEEFDEEGVCHKLVTIAGNGVVDKIPVRCDMVNYMVTNDKQLVVGDKIYSDKVDTLMVVTSQGCEQRTYSGDALAKITQLKDEDCEEVKLMMMKSFLSNDDDEYDWSVAADGDDLHDDDSDDDDSESKLKAHEELRNWISEFLDSDKGSENESKKGDSKDDDDKDFW